MSAEGIYEELSQQECGDTVVFGTAPGTKLAGAGGVCVAGDGPGSASKKT